MFFWYKISLVESSPSYRKNKGEQFFVEKMVNWRTVRKTSWKWLCEVSRRWIFLIYQPIFGKIVHQTDGMLMRWCHLQRAGRFCWNQRYNKSYQLYSAGTFRIKIWFCVDRSRLVQQDLYFGKWETIQCWLLISYFYRVLKNNYSVILHFLMFVIQTISFFRQCEFNSVWISSHHPIVLA